jgi:transglutaminase-like putative cysteine protease
MSTTAQPRSISLWDRYIQGSGLTLTLAAFLVLAVTYPVQEARWVRDMAPITFIGILSLFVTGVRAARGTTPLRAHLSSALFGVAIALASGVAMMPGSTVLQRISNLFEELSQWTAAVPSSEIRGGIVEFGIFLILVTWLLGHLAAWLALRHRQGWVAVLLGGAVLSIALSNLGGDATRELGLFMAASVLLLIHMATSHRMVGWRAKRLSFDPTTVLTQSGIILVVGLAIVVGVSAIPAPTASPLSAMVTTMEDTTDRAQAEFGRLFNGLPSRRSYKVISYGDETKFGGNPNLTDEHLFNVSGPHDDAYWRARAYTTYTSTGWESEGAEFGLSEPSPNEDLKRLTSTHGFRVKAATDTFFNAGLPASVDRATDVLTFADAPDDVLQVRIAQGRDFFPTRTNLRYESKGSRSFATRNDLRAADGEYPDVIKDRYLPLPETLPQRVRDLAVGITEGEENTYDRVEAVRSFVAEFPYNLEIAGPPEGQDGVDYFLFDLQQGYCDYYASSTAVLLRAIGIPARYVLGYASGNYNASTLQYEVLDLHYHSWVEAYFPEYGWIIFEPTPPYGIEFGGVRSGSAATPLPPIPPGGVSGEEEEEEEEEDFGALSDFAPTESFEFDTRTLVLAIASLVVIVLGLSYYRVWWSLNRYEKADEMFAKMARLGGLLGLPLRRGQTPLDYGRTLSAEVPGSEADITMIARAYSGRRYAARPIPIRFLREAELAWDRVRGVLLKRMFRVTPGRE